MGIKTQTFKLRAVINHFCNQTNSISLYSEIGYFLIRFIIDYHTWKLRRLRNLRVVSIGNQQIDCSSSWLCEAKIFFKMAQRCIGCFICDENKLFITFIFIRTKLSYLPKIDSFNMVFYTLMKNI